MKNVIQSILGTFFFASLAVPVWSLPTDGMAASLREASVESTLEVQQQKGVRVTGMVTDKDKNPLPGVTIVVANVANPSGAVTDVDGLFQITVPAKNSTLEFSYIGFKKKSVSLNGSKLLNVVLEEDASELEEVVITGYGSQKKASIIGSIETIQPQQLQFGTSRTLSNNLAGKLSGVIAIQRLIMENFSATRQEEAKKLSSLLLTQAILSWMKTVNLLHRLSVPLLPVRQAVHIMHNLRGNFLLSTK